jgi:hypothetical protein
VDQARVQHGFLADGTGFRYQSVKVGKMPIFAFLVLVLVIAGAAITTYMIRFIPYRDAIVTRIELADPAHKHVPNPIVDLTLLSEDRGRIRHHVAVRLETRMNLHNIPYLFWQVQRRVWELALLLHFTTDEIYTLWCESLYFDEIKGFNNIARDQYQRNIDELSNYEAARIIIASRIPGYFVDHQADLDAKARSLVTQYEARQSLR